MVHVGQDLKFLIDKMGISKKELSTRLGLSEPSFYRILQKEHISTKLLVQFCDALEVHPAVFFNFYEGRGKGKIAFQILTSEIDPMYLLAFDENRSGLQLDWPAIGNEDIDHDDDQKGLQECVSENKLLKSEILSLKDQVELLKDHINTLKKVNGIDD